MDPEVLISIQIFPATNLYFKLFSFLKFLFLHILCTLILTKIL